MARLLVVLDEQGVALGESSISIRSVLDTFDGKLHRGGLRCETRSERPSGPFELLTTDETGTVQRTPVAEAVPAVEDLTGPVGERLAAVASGRWLEPRLTLVVPVRVGTLEGSDGAVVAQVTFYGDGRAAAGGFRSSQSDWQATPVAVEVSRTSDRKTPDRKATKRLIEALRAASLDQVDGDVLAHTMELCGVVPAGLDTTPSVPIAQSVPASEGVRQALTHLTDTIDATWAGTIEGRDVEYLHELRIAVRRARTVLGACRTLVPDPLVAESRALFGVLGELTGPARDLDVTVAQWPEQIASLDEDKQAALGPLGVVLDERRTAAHQRLSAGLASVETIQAMDAWRAHLAEPFAGIEAGTVADEIERRIRRAHRRLVSRGRAIAVDSPAEQLHALRKDAKKLRYLIECFADLLATKPRKQYVAKLKRLQENLGEFQDSEVQAVMFRDAASDLQARGVPLETLLAIGHLGALLEARRDAARAKFADRFGSFDAGATRSSFDDMFRRRG